MERCERKGRGEKTWGRMVVPSPLPFGPARCGSVIAKVSTLIVRLGGGRGSPNQSLLRRCPVRLLNAEPIAPRAAIPIPPIRQAAGAADRSLLPVAAESAKRFLEQRLRPSSCLDAQ